MKILLAVDGSKYSRRAVDYLAGHAWLGDRDGLTVFTVVQALSQRAIAIAGGALTHGYYADEAECAFGPVREALDDPKRTVAYDWTTGQPGEEIARKAQDEEFDLVVMGSHGQTALANIVLGSVATQVLARCKVPVLLIR
jgi:nucleotide-binding universal stress UspA family protein